jgi:S-adenosylhomocysteine hydrolase
MRAIRLLSLVLTGLLLGQVGSARASAKAEAWKARRKLTEPTYDGKTLRSRIVLKQRLYDSASFSGRVIERQAKRGAAHVGEHYYEALSRLTDLDPARNLLSADEWAHVEHQFTFGGTQQVRNRDERLEFGIKDPELRVQQTRMLAEKARGKLGAILLQGLKGKKPEPETLARVTAGLAKKYPFFANPFHVEGLIADVQYLAPGLRRWNFGKVGVNPRLGGKLPPSLQRLVREIGHRAFANVNVLFADHLYEDGHVMFDTLRAMGLEPENARFVTTPYPFDREVILGMEARGVPVAHAPYDKEKTKAHVEQAIGELLERSHDNHGPILVFDDGGMAAAVIAEKFPEHMHRFRIVEITKAGERVAKETLPKQLGIEYKQLRNLDSRQLQKLGEKFIAAHSSDAKTRTKAERRWQQVLSYLRTPSLSAVTPQNQLAEHAFGFSHHTYSDSKYKREVMTPLYTQAVNRATFEALAHEGKQLTNQRVTIVGGGAMGLNAGLELRAQGYEVTFVEPDATRRQLVEGEHKFKVEPFETALKGRGLVLEMSGMHKLLRAEHLFLLDDETVVAHGSSKDNPFDMSTFKALASEVVPWKASPTGQVSATYVFEALGLKRRLHFPGNGFTISHGGKRQNVPLKKFTPEIEALVRLGVHALSSGPAPTHFPFFGTPSWLMEPGAQKKQLRQGSLSLEQ